MKIALAQLDCSLGKVEDNLVRAREAIEETKRNGVDLVVFPELFLTGYALQGIHEDVSIRCDDPRLLSLSPAEGDDPAVVIGFQERGRRLHLYNSAAYIDRGAPVHTHRKAYLATYDMFEEAKHFTPGSSMRAFDTRLGRVATLICYDVWQPAFVSVAVQDGAQVLLIPSNSADRSFTGNKDNQGHWRDMTRFYASMFECYVVFINRVGAEDSLSFWGGSHVVDPWGRIVAEGPRDVEAVITADIDLADVARRRREAPLLKEPRLALLIKELSRLAADDGHL